MGMCKRLAAALVVLGGLAGAAWAAEPDVNLVPYPQTFTRTGAGTVALTDKGRIVATTKVLAPLAAVMSDDVYMLTGVRMAVASDAGREGDIVLMLDPSARNQAAYSLSVTSANQIMVKGGGYIGAAHGTATLLQAIAPAKTGWGVPRIMVTDKPFSEYYGSMVDIARQDNSIEELKGVINMMRLYRLRFLHLHMSDDQAWTFPSTAYPNLGKSNWATRGGPIPKVNTVEQWKELVRYADERGVTFVPEIETPGHSGAARRDLPDAFANPDVGVMNVANPKMYEAMDKIVGELVEVFKSSPYIHIGCDECSLDGVAKSPAGAAFMRANRIKDSGDLFAWHIAKMHSIVTKKYGKRMIVWQDAPITDRVPKDVAILVWHIDGNNGATMDYLKQGRPVIQATWTPCVYQPVKDVLGWNAWTKDMNPKLMLGAQMLLWELSGKSAVPFLRYKSAPRNERVWNPGANRKYEDFAKRIEWTDVVLDRLLTGVWAEEKGLVNSLTTWLKDGGKGDEKNGILPLFNYDDSSTVTLKTAIAKGKLCYTTDGSNPTAESPQFKDPIKLSECGGGKVTVKACVFDAEGKAVGTVWSREYNRK